MGNCLKSLPGKCSSICIMCNCCLCNAPVWVLPSRVAPNLYVGSCRCAHNFHELHQLGITHIVNAATPSTKYACCFERRDEEFKYLNLSLRDRTSQRIAEYFDESSAFIEQALQSGGAVLVHCIQGKSRSVALVMAYLMKTKGMSVQEALQAVREVRDLVTSPNQGFMQQLHEYHAQLQRQSPTAVTPTTTRGGEGELQRI